MKKAVCLVLLCVLVAPAASAGASEAGALRDVGEGGPDVKVDSSGLRQWVSQEGDPADWMERLQRDLDEAEVRHGAPEGVGKPGGVDPVTPQLMDEGGVNAVGLEADVDIYDGGADVHACKGRSNLEDGFRTAMDLVMPGSGHALDHCSSTGSGSKDGALLYLDVSEFLPIHGPVVVDGPASGVIDMSVPQSEVPGPTSGGGTGGQTTDEGSDDGPGHGPTMDPGDEGGANAAGLEWDLDTDLGASEPGASLQACRHRGGMEREVAPDTEDVISGTSQARCSTAGSQSKDAALLYADGTEFLPASVGRQLPGGGRLAVEWPGMNVAAPGLVAEHGGPVIKSLWPAIQYGDLLLSYLDEESSKAWHGLNGELMLVLQGFGVDAGALAVAPPVEDVAILGSSTYEEGASVTENGFDARLTATYTRMAPGVGSGDQEEALGPVAGTSFSGHVCLWFVARESCIGLDTEGRGSGHGDRSGALMGSWGRLTGWHSQGPDHEAVGRGDSTTPHGRGGSARDDPDPTWVPATDDRSKPLLGSGQATSAFWWFTALATIPAVWLLVTLFSRLRRETALQHPLRKELMAVLEARPGTHFMALVRQTSRPRGVVQHHLRKLQELDVVGAKRAGRYTVYWLRGELGRGGVAELAPHPSGQAARIVAALDDHPGRTNEELAALLALPKSTLSYNLGRLLQQGRIRWEPAGRYKKWFPCR